jgi:hypothetical protein
VLRSAVEVEKISIVRGNKSEAETLAKGVISTKAHLNVGVCISYNKVRGDVDEIWEEHGVTIFTLVTPWARTSSWR